MKCLKKISGIERLTSFCKRSANMIDGALAKWALPFFTTFSYLPSHLSDLFMQDLKTSYMRSDRRELDCLEFSHFDNVLVDVCLFLSWVVCFVQ